jgi:hypothetical protein
MIMITHSQYHHRENYSQMITILSTYFISPKISTIYTHITKKYTLKIKKIYNSLMSAINAS